MNVREMSLEDLELLSYTDIAYELLKLDKKPKTTPVLFGEVCKLLEIGEDAMYEMIGDFYTTLTTDKRFLLLNDATWDLKETHVVKPIIDDEDEEDEAPETEDEEVEYKESDETEDEAVEEDAEDYDDSDAEDDDLDDLSIVTEEEMEE